MSFGYTYNSGGNSIAATLLMVYGIFVVTGGLIALAAYILKGIGLYTIAKNQGNENAWLAFIPFARKYQQGELAGEIQLKNKSISRPGIWFVGLPIAWGILSYLVGMIFSILVVGKMIRYGVMGYHTYDSIGTESLGLIGFFLFFIVLAIVYKVIYKILLILIDVKILSSYTSGNMPIIHSVFAVFIPLYESICFFVISRRIAKENAEKQSDYAGDTAYTRHCDMGGYSAYTESMQTEPVVEDIVSEEPVADAVVTEDDVSEEPVADAAVTGDVVSETIADQPVEFYKEAASQNVVFDKQEKTEE